MTKLAHKKQNDSGMKLLWGTANLFSHPRYMNGAATNPDFNVVTYAASQVKGALDATIELGGENYVFWGGREGYSTLLNTNMKKELDHLAIFLDKAKEYGRKNGFKGTFLIEPKPMEPSKHQYDFDVASVVAFLKHYGLENDFKINIENNHATLAGHTFAHEIQSAYDYKLLGSLDINQGDPQNGWDTDEFLHNIYDAVYIMMIILQEGGLGSGGMNFDAKTRRNSTDLEDIFIGHINSMDTLARGLLIADNILKFMQSSHRAVALYTILPRFHHCYNFNTSLRSVLKSNNTLALLVHYLEITHAPRALFRITVIRSRGNIVHKTTTQPPSSEAAPSSYEKADH